LLNFIEGRETCQNGSEEEEKKKRPKLGKRIGPKRRGNKNRIRRREKG